MPNRYPEKSLIHRVNIGQNLFELTDSCRCHTSLIIDLDPRGLGGTARQFLVSEGSFLVLGATWKTGMEQKITELHRSEPALYV
jgi:hypothetical protein